MEPQVFSTQKAPQAIGPYSQAVKVGNMLYVSGQLPINPENGELINEDVELATKQVMENLKAIIEDAGSNLQNVIKTTIFLKDINQFDKVNVIYGQYFSENPPARVCVEVARLPKDANIEIEAVALIK
ncbi:MAG: putative endoribonuclease [Clostridiales bacterium]|jgi:2-iminobutanoate/2-iminopropanoate deaminase|nr:putative endoribonuclease [Clostridiales bacterium]